jgi:hypothetical protein
MYIFYTQEGSTTTRETEIFCVVCAHHFILLVRHAYLRAIRVDDDDGAYLAGWALILFITFILQDEGRVNGMEIVNPFVSL